MEKYIDRDREDARGVKRKGGPAASSLASTTKSEGGLAPGKAGGTLPSR